MKIPSERRAIYNAIDALNMLLNVYIEEKNHSKIDAVKAIKEQVNNL